MEHCRGGDRLSGSPKKESGLMRRLDRMQLFQRLVIIDEIFFLFSFCINLLNYSSCTASQPQVQEGQLVEVSGVDDAIILEVRRKYIDSGAIDQC